MGAGPPCRIPAPRCRKNSLARSTPPRHLWRQPQRAEGPAMVQYDEKIIQQFADQLYRTAQGIIWSYTIWGALLGGLVIYVVGRVLGGHTAPPLVAVFAVLLGAAGYSLGLRKAFDLKLRA